MKRCLQVLSFALLFAAGWTSEAGPCSCAMGRFPEFLVPSGVTLPANARGVPCFNVGSPSTKVSVVHAKPGLPEGGGTPVDFTIQSIPCPDSYSSAVRADSHTPDSRAIALICFDRRPGETYRVSLDKKSILVHASNDELKESACEVQVWKNSRGDLTTMTLWGMCSVTIDAQSVGVELVGDLVDRWKESLLYLTVVDGKIAWKPQEGLCSHELPGISWVGRGRELVYCDCSRAEPDQPREATWCLPKGAHTITMIAWLPGVTEVSASTTVTLACQ